MAYQMLELGSQAVSRCHFAILGINLVSASPKAVLGMAEGSEPFQETPGQEKEVSASISVGHQSPSVWLNFAFQPDLPLCLFLGACLLP